MGLRLYDSAWVTVAGQETQLKVSKDRKNPAAFNVGDFQYDIDARPLTSMTNAPAVTAILSLQAAKEAGLSTEYHQNSDMLW